VKVKTFICLLFLVQKVSSFDSVTMSGLGLVLIQKLSLLWTHVVYLWIIVRWLEYYWKRWLMSS